MKIVFLEVFDHFSKSFFYGGTKKHGSHAYRRYFQLYVNYGPGSYICGPVLTLNRKKIMSKVSLSCILPQVFTGCMWSLSWSLEPVLEVCRIWASRNITSGAFLTPNRAKIRLKHSFRLFCKRFSRDSHEAWFKLSETFRCMWNMGSRGHTFVSFLTTPWEKINQKSVFVCFAKFPLDSRETWFSNTL